MAKHKVEITGINTNDIEVLSNENMISLFKKMQSGDKSAREKLINGNLKLVLSILKRFNKKEENMDDLFQVGCIGLVKAIDNFDLSYGVKFSTYCVPMVLGEVKRYLRDNNSIRISRSIKDIAYKVIKLKDELTVKNGIEPSDKEIADILGIAESDIVMAMEALRPPVSLFEPIYNDGGDTIYLFDQVADNSLNKDLDLTLATRKAISNLSEREQYILDQRFVIGKTQTEVAEEIGISQAQISRLEKGAIQRVRKQI